MSDSRAEFEAWVETLGGHPFAGQFLNLMWNAWQASRAQPERKLTDAEILKLAADYGIECDGNFHRTDDEDRANMVDFARALLAAQPAAATVPNAALMQKVTSLLNEIASFNELNEFNYTNEDVAEINNWGVMVWDAAEEVRKALPAAQPQDDGDKRCQ